MGNKNFKLNVLIKLDGCHARFFSPGVSHTVLFTEVISPIMSTQDQNQNLKLF